MSKLILPDHVKRYRESQQPTMQVNHCIVTGIDEVSGAIVTDSYAILDDKVIDHIQQIADTKEHQVMAALVRLGWTPPDKES